MKTDMHFIVTRSELFTSANSNSQRCFLLLSLHAVKALFGKVIERLLVYHAISEANEKDCFAKSHKQ